MSWHTAVPKSGRRWLTLTASAIVCTAVFVACGQDGTNKSLTGPRFATGSVGVNLDQCANLSTPNCSWQNGDLNGNNSAFAEGEVVPFRLAVEGLSAGSHTIHLNYDFTAGGNEGYDFLATYNATETVAICATGGGGVSSLCPLGAPDDVEPFPVETFAVPDANNLTVQGAVNSALFGITRNLSIWGGTITSISTPTHTGPTGGNSSVDLTVTFTSNGSAVLLAWGAHLAQSNFWKEGTADDGASVISGAPWHMRTQSLDGSGGNKNQDRSIQPSAVIDLAPAVTIVKKTNGTDNNAAPGPTITVGSTVTWTYEVTNTGNVALTNVVVTDDQIVNDATDIVCPGATTPKNVIASLAVGATVTCTATGTAVAGQYTNIGTASDGTVSDTDPDNYLGQTPVLSMKKVTTPSTISAGDPFSWTITLTNDGPGTATGATIADNLPVITGVTYSLDVANSDVTCSLDTGVSPNALECGPKDLAVNATLVAKIDATTTPNQGCVSGGFTNTANGAAGNASGVTATGTITLQCPSLTITKTPDNGSIVAGNTATFTIVVSNTGAGKAFNVALSDQLLNTLAWAVGTNPGWTTCGVSGTQLLTCSVASLAAGASATVTVSATVPTSFIVVPPTANGTQLEMDGNLIHSGSGTDWDNSGVSCVATVAGCSLDASGSTDDSFGNGTKEDTPVPSLTDGSIPPNKSDLTRFYITNNRVTVGSAVHDFIYLAWERVLDPSGTTNMDFELNQNATLSGNGATPLRKAGDVLIKYDLSKGGGSLTMGYHRWITSGTCEANGATPPCWDQLHSLAGAFQGKANDFGNVDDPLQPNATRSLTTLTFGEASIDMQAAGIFTAGQCLSFGKAYLKSRSSDSFTAAIKDFVRPATVSITNCLPANIPNTASVSATNVSAISDGGQITVTVP